MIDGKKIKSVIQKKEKLDFIYIGTGRAASTWIYECLKEHPEICVPLKKETSPFTKGGKEINEKLFTNLRSCGNNQIKGTFVPGFFIKKENAYLLKRHFPHIKIIACLRNPIERAYSHYWLERSVGRISYNTSFDEAVKKVPKYLNLGFYYESIKLYFDLFGRDNVIVLIYEDIEKNPKYFMNKIYRFLGIDFSFTSVFLKRQINPSTQVRLKFPFLQRIIKFIFNLGKNIKKYSLGKEIINLLKKLRIHFFVSRLNSMNVKDPMGLNLRPFKKPFLPLSTKQNLYNLYIEDIKKMEKLIDRNLYEWKN